MMKRILCCVALAACGGGSSKSTATTPPAVDPVPMAEGSPADEPAKPGDPPAASDPALIKASLIAAEMAAFDKAKPVFDKWCAKCHSKDGKKQSAAKREHFDMTTYPFGGHHAMDVHNEIREVLGLTGKKPTMPADHKGAVQGEELEAIKAWADAFEASHRAGAHDTHGSHQH